MPDFARILGLVDDRLTTAKGHREFRSDERAFVRRVCLDLKAQHRPGMSEYKPHAGVASIWFATDGSGGYYRFTHVDWGLQEPIGYCIRARLIARRHGLTSLSQRRPAGFISRATLAAASHGGFEGPPSQNFGKDPKFVEAFDLDIALADRLARDIDKNAGFQHDRSLHDYR